MTQLQGIIASLRNNEEGGSHVELDNPGDQKKNKVNQGASNGQSDSAVNEDMTEQNSDVQIHSDIYQRAAMSPEAIGGQISLSGGEWEEVMARKTKQRMRQQAKKAVQEKSEQVSSRPSMNNQATAFKLTGIPKEDGAHLYIENIRIPSGAKNADIIKSVVKCADDNKVRIMSCFVRRNRYARDQVGCKITVPQSQVHKCKSSNMWGEGIYVRDWEIRPRVTKGFNSNGYRKQYNEHGFGYDQGYRDYDRDDGW